MNAVVPFREKPAVDYSGAQLSLIKRTIAVDTNDDEFNLFIEVAKSMGLDPFRKQIMPLVFSKGDASKRRMSLITGIDGFRVIASRCDDYRPDEDEPEIVRDPKLVSPTNPLGIEKAKVRVWKMDRNSRWNPITGVAYWDEFAPVTKEGEGGFEWVDTDETWPDTGKPKKKKKPIGEVVEKLDTSGNWGKMPRVMIAKCAEAQALRKGWPEAFGGLYDAAEMDRARTADMAASEIVAQEEEDRRMARIGRRGDLMVTFVPTEPMQRIPAGQFFDRVMAWLRNDCDGGADLAQWGNRNRETLKEFWAVAPNDALELKKELEKATERFAKEAEAEAKKAEAGQQ